MVTSCGGGENSQPNTNNDEKSNKSPSIEHISNQQITELDELSITANATDADGNITNLSWTQESGVTLTIVGSDTSTVLIKAPEVDSNETAVLKLIATDDDGASASLSVTISILNIPNALPSIEGINDQQVDENSTISISAIASDTDGTIVSYLWEQKSGVELSLSNTDIASLLISTPEVEADENTVITLTVADNDGGESTIEVKLTVADVPLSLIAKKEGDTRFLEWNNNQTYSLLYGELDSDPSDLSRINKIKSPYNLDWLDLYHNEFEFHLVNELGIKVSSTTLKNETFSKPVATLKTGNAETYSYSIDSRSSLVLDERYLYTTGTFGANEGDFGQGDYFNIYDLKSAEGIKHVFSFKDSRDLGQFFNLGNHLIIASHNQSFSLFDITDITKPVHLKDLEEFEILGTANEYIFSKPKHRSEILIHTIDNNDIVLSDTIEFDQSLSSWNTKLISGEQSTLLLSNDTIYSLIKNESNVWEVVSSLEVEGLGSSRIYTEAISSQYLIVANFNTTNNQFTFDISDPYQMTLVSVESLGYSKQIKLHDDNLFTIGNNKVTKFELSDINSPKLVGSQNIDGQYAELFGEHIILFLHSTLELELHNLDIELEHISDDITFYNTNYPASGIIEVGDDIAVISNSLGGDSCYGSTGCYHKSNTKNSGINIYQDGLNSSPINIYFEPNRAQVDAIINNDRLYAVDNRDIFVFDISDLSSPLLLGSEQSVVSPNAQFNFHKIDNLILFDTSSKFMVFDSIDPNLSGAIQTFYPKKEFRGGGLFEKQFILNGRDEFSIFDFANQDQVEITRNNNGSHTTIDSANNGVFASSARNNLGTILYSFEDYNLKETSTLKNGDVYLKSVAKDHMIYININGLVVVDVSNPDEPETVLTAKLPVKEYLSATIINNHIYIGAIDGVLTVPLPSKN